MAPQQAPAPTPPQPAPTPIAAPHDSTPFAWDAFLERVKEQSPGTCTILQKCGYGFDGTSLTIFAGRKFNKTQIDKAFTVLTRTLAILAPEAKEVIVLATPKPPEDSQTAAVLDIMGGGEEVTI